MDSEQRAFLGMPGYGHVTAGAGRGFWRSTCAPNQVHFQYAESSLLAQNFNRLWCTALNMVHLDNRVDYFAMQHADVEPEDFWFDRLLAELEESNLDVLGVVVPIKDPNGLTSIALDGPGDDFEPLCRLTMQEVFRLPETFTSSDVGHQLLLNTGLWVCRFDPDWNKRITFTINDRIVFDKSKGLFVPQVEPEDWNFSRQCNRLGLRLGVTRKIGAIHRGEMGFANTHPWGDPVDTAYVPESVIPLTVRAPADGFVFPHDVDGWLSEREGRALAELARGKSVLEIGSYCGKSTICMGQTAKLVFALDTFDGRGTPRPRDTLNDLCKNLDRYGLRANGSPKVQPLVGTLDCRPNDWGWNGPQFDLIFIDGAHDYESVQSDLDNAIPLLNPGGLIAFHDYREHPGQYDGRWDEGVTQAVNEFLSAGAELVSTHDSLAVVRPPAAIPLEV